MARNHEPGTVLEVKAGPHDRKNAFVAFECGGGCDCQTGHTLYELDESGNRGAIVPCQCLTDCGCEDECEGGCSEMVWMVPELKAGQTKRYVMDKAAAGAGDDDASGVAMDVKPEEQVDISVGGKPFTSYVVKEGIARPYCYPVYGPGGAEMTNFAPGDHVHHKSLYVAQGDVNGFDNWSELEGHACTVNEDVLVTAQGPVFGEMVSFSDWVSPKGSELLREITRIRVYNTPDCCRILDFETTWFAEYGGVFFGDTKEAGTVSVRVAESMEVKNGGTIRNSYGGINDDECWGKRAEWVDYYGPVTSGTAGITIMDHPGNLRFPTHWHVRGYGLFTANQWGIHDFTGDFSQRGDLALEEGDALTFLFRLYIHAGDTDQADVAAKYLDFIYPPTVAVAK